MTDALPWERRDSETVPAFEAFRTYRDLGLSRNHKTVASVLGKSTQLLARWSVMHDWVERCRAFDAQRDTEHLDASLAQEQQLMAKLLDSAEMMRHRAHEVLLNSDDISPALAVRMLEAAAKILATRRGLKDDAPETTATVDVVALATELINRGRTKS